MHRGVEGREGNCFCLKLRLSPAEFWTIDLCCAVPAGRALRVSVLAVPEFAERLLVALQCGLANPLAGLCVVWFDALAGGVEMA